MRKRRSHSAQNKDEGQAAESSLHGPAVIKHVLRHRKTKSDHPGINDTVDDAVEFIFLPQKEDEKNKRLGTFLDNRRRDHRAKSLPDLRIVRGDRRNDRQARIENKGDK